MVLIMRIVVGLIGVFFLVFGLRFMATPADMAVQFFVEPLGIAGLSTIRGDLGGAFLATAFFLFLGLGTGVMLWLRAAAIIIGTIALGRLVGFVFDGATPDTLLPFAVEAVFVALIVIAARRLRAATPAP